MKKKRIGFTLPEILMTLVIAGFIATLSVQAINVNRTAYTSLAFYAFNNLKSAVGELIIPESQGENLNEDGSGSYTILAQGPFGFEERLLNTDPIVFCKGMYEIMNTQGDDDCSTIHSFTANDINDNSFLEDGGEPNFVTTNGQKYYFGQYNAGEAFVNGNPPTNGTYGYRIIAIDINGDAEPNSSESKGSLPPDIISFAILDSGEILPLGAAANNCRIENGVCATNTNGEGKTYNYLTSKLNAFRFKDPTGASTPAFCEKTGTCDYDKVYLQNPQNNKIGFSFRQAYCGARISEDEVLKDYCNGSDLVQHNNCPPNGDEYDICKQEVIKPMFRFNFK